MKTLIGTFLLAIVLVACPSPGGSPLQSGVFQARIVYKNNQVFTNDLFEISFGTNTVSGFRYACDANWQNCAPKGTGLPVTGTYTGNTADFSFTFSNTGPFNISGTFATASFSGTFTKPAETNPDYKTGTITMTWVAAQR